ncbi:MAG: hypothetical protein ACYTHJ_12310 [Planctomycetota bacterium]|jgi:hypothetical protein
MPSTRRLVAILSVGVSAVLGGCMRPHVPTADERERGLIWLILGVGTRTFGTMDCVHATSAGKDGFDVKKALPDSELRKKRHQQPWTLEMARYGHFGGHGTILIYEWNRQYVAPWLLDPPTGGTRKATGRAAGDR